MPLELLQHALRIKPRIGVVEPGDEAERDDVVLRSINPCPAILFRGERPSHGVNHFARRDAARGDLPEFFHADAVGLRVGVFGKIEFLNELLGKRSARAFGQNDDFGLQIVSGLEVGFLMAFFIDALVVSADANHAIAVVEQFRSSEAGEDGDARLFHLAAQPLHESVQRDHIVAVIAQERRRNRQLELALLGEKVDRFLRDFGIEWSLLFKSGKQFAHRARVEQRAGKAVLPDLASFFEDVDVLFAELRVRVRGIVCVDQLCQP